MSVGWFEFWVFTVILLFLLSIQLYNYLFPPEGPS